jgi:hypothetical protein
LDPSVIFFGHSNTNTFPLSIFAKKEKTMSSSLGRGGGGMLGRFSVPILILMTIFAFLILSQQTQG